MGTFFMIFSPLMGAWLREGLTLSFSEAAPSDSVMMAACVTLFDFCGTPPKGIGSRPGEVHICYGESRRTVA